ncbi:MAG: oligosaccharide flippase family protein, partial [Candidatus Omnitrophota bacterium]
MNAKRIVTHKEKKIVFGNFVSLTSLQSINYILPLIMLPYLVRVLGMEKFGLIAFAQALVQYFLILTDYGFSLSATKTISLVGDNKQKINQVFSSVMTVKLIFTGLSFIIICALLYFVPKFKTDWPVYMLSFGSVVGGTLFPVWFFQGKEKMNYITIVNIISGLISLGFIFIF